MRKFVLGGLGAAAVAAALAAPAVSSAAGPNPGDGSACTSQPGQSGCAAVWTADVNGEYGGVTDGSWAIQQQVTVNGVTSWQTIASGGAGPFAGGQNSLTAGSTYQLVITGDGGGALGSITGTGTI